jgi:hypothetical protein
MNGHARRRKTVITRDQAISLLYPVAAFFSSGGMSRAKSLAALASAIDDIRRYEGRRELEHIGTWTCYADVIATWSREHKFLDSQGRPRPLSVSGPNGFTGLVRRAGVHQEPRRMLRVLTRYGNVRRLRDGRVQLLSPLFRAGAGSRMAFEPISCFLNDAASALTHTLKNASTPTNPDLFWRAVESVHISSAKVAAQFIEFAKERSQLFLEELEDWLRAHGRQSTRRSKKRLRVGLGLFSIYSSETDFS